MPSIAWNDKRAAHLLRRAGFGGTPDQVARAVQIGREAAVNELVNFEGISTARLDSLLASYNFDLTTFYDVLDPRYYAQFIDLLRWWYLRLIYTPRPLEEKLALFWHNHFANSLAKVDLPPLMYEQNNLFRSLGPYRFQTLLLEVAKNPCMLFFLDNNTNVKDAIQENWGRELLELFTMGVSNGYGQSDVRAAAAAFTGWTTAENPPYAFRFDSSQHDDGSKTFLGQTGNLDGGDIIAILVGRRETAQYVTTKLARFFLGKDPRPALARRLQDLWFASDANIKALVREILLSDEFDESADRNDQIKSPVEFIVGAMRSLGAATNAEPFFSYGAAAGQFLFSPPNVAGWTAYRPPAQGGGGRHWLNTGLYFARTGFANDLAAARPGPPELSWDAENFFAGAQVTNRDDLINDLEYRFAMTFSASLRNGLRNYLAAAGNPFPWNPESRDRWGRQAVGLVLKSPDYQVQ